MAKATTPDFLQSNRSLHFSLHFPLHFQTWGTDGSELGQCRRNETKYRHMDRRGIKDYCRQAGREIIGKEVPLKLEICLFWMLGYAQCQEAYLAHSRSNHETGAI